MSAAPRKRSRSSQRLGNPMLTATLGAFPMFAYLFAGYGPKWSKSPTASSPRSDRTIRSAKRLPGSARAWPRCRPAPSASCIWAGSNEAEAQCREGLQPAESTGEAEVLGLARSCDDLARLYARRTSPALEHGRRCLEIANKIDNDSSLVIGVFLARELLSDGGPGGRSLRGAAARAQPSPEIAWRFSPSFRRSSPFSPRRNSPSEKRPRPKLRRARRSRRARAGGCDYYEAHALLSLAEVLLAAEGAAPKEEIGTALDRAAALVEKTEGRSLVAADRRIARATCGGRGRPQESR